MEVIKNENIIRKIRKRKMCKCGKARPSFNLPERKAEYCKSCKEENMINVVDKRCVCGKVTSPNFNYENLQGKYCFTCKLDGMIDVRCKMCDCGNSRNFNYEGLKPICCSLCKLVNMIDVCHDRCFCKIALPNFNYPGLKSKYCSLCKLEGMIDVSHIKCIVCKITQPVYNYEGLKPQYCVKCKNDNMIDVWHTKCKTLYCEIRVQDKYEGYCFRCFIHMYPDRPVQKNYKTKEFSVVEYITNVFSDYTWITDKKIQEGCSLKRPDLLLDLGYQVIIIEVDENQHKKYDCSCQNKRIMELSQDVGHRPIIFIRFNPDDYIDEIGNKIISCWTITKQTGMMKINNIKEWNVRLEHLKELVDYWITPENKTDKTVEIIELYYNQNM